MLILQVTTIRVMDTKALHLPVAELLAFRFLLLLFLFCWVEYLLLIHFLPVERPIMMSFEKCFAFLDSIDYRMSYDGWQNASHLYRMSCDVLGKVLPIRQYRMSLVR